MKLPLGLYIVKFLKIVGQVDLLNLISILKRGFSLTKSRLSFTSRDTTFVALFEECIALARDLWKLIYCTKSKSKLILSRMNEIGIILITEPCRLTIDRHSPTFNTTLTDSL